MSQTFQTILDEAERAGLVAAGQSERLSLFLAERGVTAPVAADGEAAVLEDSEQPRFVRGFHDILITIGILVLMAGIVGILGFPLATLPVIVALSEVFVRRQRLALPSVVLSVLFVVASTSGALLVRMPFETDAIFAAAVMTASSGLYHWRYRTPISLAGVYFGLVFLIFVTTILVLFRTTNLETAATTGDLGMSIVSAILALGLFVVAMRYDLSDPVRQTRRSDVAFWLHLGAAPLLLHAVIGLFSGGGWSLAGLGEGAAGLVITAVVLLMAIGLIIDRRAFVTSGLISLGVALGTLLRERMSSLLDVDFSLVAIVIGIIVLSIGLFWQPLRKLLLSMLPQPVTRRLPPVR